MRYKLLKFLGVCVFSYSVLAFGGIVSSDDIDTTSLKSSSVAADVDAQLEKIFKNVKDFHIFQKVYSAWFRTDVFTTLVTGQNGFPIFSARSDKDPKFTDYPINYTNNRVERYKPVRPPESVKNNYTDAELGNKDTATYHAPMVAAGTIGKGRVIVMGSHLYASILVNPRNYSDNYSNADKDTNNKPDSIDMENFFHNILTWLTEQNDNASNRYGKDTTPIKILSNKEKTMFWNKGNHGKSYANGSDPFKIHSNFNISTDENPRLIPTWKEAQQQGLLNPLTYPLVILEDFRRDSSYTDNDRTELTRKTQLDEVALIVNYIRAGGGVLIMDSPAFKETDGVSKTAANEIMKKAGVHTFFAQNVNGAVILPLTGDVGGIDEYNMCALDYIWHTDLIRRLGLSDYSNVPTTLEDLKSLLAANGKLDHLEEVLQRRKRKIFLKGTEVTADKCGTVEIEAGDSKINIQTSFIAGDGVKQQNSGQYDLYAKYPIDLNFVQAQGDVGGSMNTLLAHELANTSNTKKENLLTGVDLNREYTNMSALLINDATFSGDKFATLNNLLNQYKTGDFVNNNQEFNPGFSFATKEVLDYRKKPVTRIMLERSFYDTTLKYDPSQFPGQTSTSTSDKQAVIYLKRNINKQKWYANNMQSTGLYAPAHTDITVTLPSNVDEKKIQLIIGVGDNVTGIFRHEINLKRPPKYVKKYKFINSNGAYVKEITVQHPYGGLIFLKSFDSSATNTATATINFSGVQEAVRFVLGKTTESEWNALRSSAVAPKAELESKHYIVTVAKKNMSELTFNAVTTLANGYDAVAQNAYDFYGYDRECGTTFNEHTPPSCDKKKAHKNREVFDPHISIGSGHSGYPIMVMKWKPDSTTFPQNPKDSWLLWHEMGHNMVESWLAIPGATEVANNVMALHQQKRFSQKLTTDDGLSNASAVLNKTQPWADGGNFGRLLMFAQLTGWIESNYLSTFKTKNSKYYVDGHPKASYPFLNGDGFDIFKILHREARDVTTSGDKYDVCMKQSDKTTADMLAICSSAILELDLSNFYTAWKAGVVGIGNSGGVNIYDYSGSISNNLDTGFSALPSPAIQEYN